MPPPPNLLRKLSNMVHYGDIWSPKLHIFTTCGFPVWSMYGGFYGYDGCYIANQVLCLTIPVWFPTCKIAK